MVTGTLPTTANVDDGKLATLGEFANTDFAHVPRSLRRRVYGIPYAEFRDADGGQLWVTRHGWRHLPHLHPCRWFDDRQYDRRGRHLSAGTGAVFRVGSRSDEGRSIDLVVKFSRFAQEVRLDIPRDFPGSQPADSLDGVDFNDPFQEFSLLEQLRQSRLGPPDLRILTKRPLAIYSPARRFEAWQLGRTEDRFLRRRRRMEVDQARYDGRYSPVELSLDRQYIVLFHWVRGTDLETLMRQGRVSAEETERLVTRSVDDLAAKGFRVLDTKPNHIITRHQPGKGLITRRGRTVYAIVDFELLQRIKGHR